MLKKTAIIVLIILAATTALIGGYFLIIKTAELITGTSPTTPPAPAKPEGKMIKLSDRELFDYWIYISPASTSSPSTTSYYYITTNGEIYKANIGEDDPVATQPIENLQSIQAVNDGSLVLVMFGNKANPQYSILNIKERSWQPLPLSVRSATFSPKGDQLALLVSTNGKNDILIQDLSPQAGSGGKLQSKRILSLYQKDLEIRWLTPEKIILSEKPSQFTTGSVWQVDTKTAAIKRLTGDMSGLTIKWSKDGVLGIRYSLETQEIPRISIIDNKGGRLASLDFVTIPDKCMISSVEIFCSVPNTLTAQSISGLLDAYLKNGNYFLDRLYHYKKTGSEEYTLSEFIEYEVPTDAAHLAREGNILTFINRIDRILYQLEL